MNKREIEQFFFIARISARLRLMSFPHEQPRDKYFFSTQEYPRDCGLCHFRMNKRKINIFFLRKKIRETADGVISAFAFRVISILNACDPCRIDCTCVISTFRYYMVSLSCNIDILYEELIFFCLPPLFVGGIPQITGVCLDHHVLNE